MKAYGLHRMREKPAASLARTASKSMPFASRDYYYACKDRPLPETTRVAVALTEQI